MTCYLQSKISFQTVKILNRQPLIVDNSKSKLGFATTGGGSWKVWDRFITYDGQPLFHIGNVCGTCSFFFERLENALDKSIVPGELIARLNSGLTSLDPGLVKDYSVLFPDDTYEVLWLEIFPHLVFPNDKNDYFVNDLWKTWEIEEGENSQANTEYYRGLDKNILEEDKVFEFFIPLYPSSRLHEKRINFYEEQIKMGHKPTALAVSILDVKSPGFYPSMDGKEVKPDFLTHWCLANYLIDGHHKIQAAHRQKKSITLLSYLSRGASWRQVDELIAHVQ